jgi:putative ABC transport system permease protein
MGERDYFSDSYMDKVESVIETLEAELGEDYEFLTVMENKSTAALDEYCDKVSIITLIFPVFFTAVSALVVMTTVTRMVEEERPIIACLKSLGMSDGKITFKYLFLTIICCLFSVAVGMVVGFAVLPTVIYPAFETMFYMPPMSENLYPMAGILAFVAMSAVVLLVTYGVCRASLREKPAQLLTAKAPKAGKKIWLEYLPFLWRPLSFKYKSSIRNIFRYKKHLIMTVLSVAGATALTFAGFAILDVADKLAEDGGSFVGMKDSIAAIAVVVIIFALLLCVFVIYNLTNLNIGERKKEIATLDVLGYHSAERLGYIYREIVMMAILGAIVGIGLGMALVQFVLVYLDFGSLADARWTAYVFSFVLVMVFVVITDLLLASKILKIDMTTSLKSND